MTDQISKIEAAMCADNHGQLFVVATPIGNLGDISQRAIDVLASVSCILAEDTRHSKRLLNHYGVSTKLRSCHEYNEESLLDWVRSELEQGSNLAIISDAGTPLISDPGFVLVRALRESEHDVVAVPGPSSIIAALSIAGLPTDGFVYDGFLPSKSVARKTALAQYLHQPRTVVLLESSHRIKASVEDLCHVLGAERRVVLARELTKRFETVLSGSAETVLERLQADDDQTRGEFVLMLAGAPALPESEAQTEHILNKMLSELSVKQAASLTAKITGQRKNDVYDIAVRMKNKLSPN